MLPDRENNKKKTTKPKKFYYRIGEVGEIYGVKPHVLRYWEQEFAQLRPDKLRTKRCYSEKDLEVVATIKDLLYNQGYTIEGARNQLEKNAKSTIKSSDDENAVNQVVEDLEELLCLLKG